jgi:hypothetical protein
LIGVDFDNAAAREIPFSLELSKASVHTLCWIYGAPIKTGKEWEEQVHYGETSSGITSCYPPCLQKL